MSFLLFQVSLLAPKLLLPAEAFLLERQNHDSLTTKIIGDVILYLGTDNSSLRNCALVCKSWTPGCRRHIFFHVVFKPTLGFFTLV